MFVDMGGYWGLVESFPARNALVASRATPDLEVRLALANLVSLRRSAGDIGTVSFFMVAVDWVSDTRVYVMGVGHLVKKFN